MSSFLLSKVTKNSALDSHLWHYKIPTGVTVGVSIKQRAQIEEFESFNIIT